MHACTQVVRTPGGQTVIGYTDLPSRLPAQSSTLYSNNISKFLLSMGPFSTGNKGEWVIDYDDEAVSIHNAGLGLVATLNPRDECRCAAADAFERGGVEGWKAGRCCLACALPAWGDSTVGGGTGVRHVWYPHHCPCAASRHVRCKVSVCTAQVLEHHQTAATLLAAFAATLLCSLTHTLHRCVAHWCLTRGSCAGQRRHHQRLQQQQLLHPLLPLLLLPPRLLDHGTCILRLCAPLLRRRVQQPPRWPLVLCHLALRSVACSQSLGWPPSADTRLSGA